MCFAKELYVLGNISKAGPLREKTPSGSQLDGRLSIHLASFSRDHESLPETN